MSERELIEEVEREAWERHNHETSRSFEAFIVYRDMGPRRSLRKVAAAMRKNVMRINEWSSKNGWVERTLAWDDYQDKIRREGQIEAIKTMNQRHIKLAQLLQSKAIDKLSKMGETDISNMSPRDIGVFLDLAVKVERLAIGAPNEIVETREGDNSAGRMSRAILDSEGAMQKALDLLDEIASDEATKRGRNNQGTKPTNL